jgi:hypothetical protein
MSRRHPHGNNRLSNYLLAGIGLRCKQILYHPKGAHIVTMLIWSLFAAMFLSILNGKTAKFIKCFSKREDFWILLLKVLHYCLRVTMTVHQ